MSIHESKPDVRTARLMKVYDCEILLSWLRNCVPEKDDQLQQSAFEIIVENPELLYLQQFLVQTFSESDAKRFMLEKIIEMFKSESSIKWDTSLQKIRYLFVCLQSSLFTPIPSCDRPGAEPCFDM